MPRSSSGLCMLAISKWAMALCGSVQGRTGQPPLLHHKHVRRRKYYKLRWKMKATALHRLKWDYISTLTYIYRLMQVKTIWKYSLLRHAARVLMMIRGKSDRVEWNVCKCFWSSGRADLIRGQCAVHGDIVCRFRTAPRVGGDKIAEFLWMGAHTISLFKKALKPK